MCLLVDDTKATPISARDRQFRLYLLQDLSALATALDVNALSNQHLGRTLGDALQNWSPTPAVTAEELAACHKVYAAMSTICNQSARLQWAQGMGLEEHDADDLARLGWFETVQPLAVAAVSLFMKRGRMDEALT
jgi:hypothetical protein